MKIKIFLPLLMMMCLAFAGVSQSALGPPVDDPTSVNKAMMDMDYEPGLYPIPADQSKGHGTTCNAVSDKDLSVSGSPITTAGTLSLKLDDGTIVYSNGKILIPERSSQFKNPNLPYAYAYLWNPGYVGW